MGASHQGGPPSWQSEAEARTRFTGGMDYGETLDVLRGWVGSEIALNVTDETFGLADGYIADFNGEVHRVDEPHPGVDAPVVYFRIRNAGGLAGGFGLHEAMFRSSEWREVAGVKELRIDLTSVVVTLSPVAL